MKPRILLVDDEPLVLDGLRRHLRSGFDITVADGGEAGLSAIRESEPFAVIVSDMRMPKMSGAQFLEAAKQLSPDSARMILSGHSDLEAAIDAVNEGQILRFLTKPCDPVPLREALNEGVRQFNLIHVERKLLEETLQGAVSAMAQLSGLGSNTAAARSERIQKIASQILDQLELRDSWELRLAITVSQIGCISVPDTILQRFESGERLSDDEYRLFLTHPELASQLLNNIPRLDRVARIVAYTRGIESFEPPLAFDEQIGRQVIRVAIAIDKLIRRGDSMEAAAAKAVASADCMDVSVKQAVSALANSRESWVQAQLWVKDLRPGMVLDQEVLTQGGLLLLAKGTELKEAHIARLVTVHADIGADDRISVLERKLAQSAVA